MNFPDFDQASEIVFSRTKTLASEHVSIGSALNRYASLPVIANRPDPPFSHAAMDGFALRVTDTLTATPEQPKKLRPLADIFAGGTLKTDPIEGTCIPIATGAPVPSGIDAVIKKEEVEENDGLIEFGRPARHFENIRQKGEFHAAGDTLIETGEIYTPHTLALAASSGQPSIAVHKVPRVFVLTTGDELIALGEKSHESAVFNSNRYMMEGFVLGQHCQVHDYRHLPDNLADTEKGIREALNVADCVVMTGGVSVGKRDFVKPALKKIGVDIHFEKIRIKPGKPCVFGTYARSDEHSENPRSIPIFGLPGTPVAAALLFRALIVPCLRKLAGANSPQDKAKYAELLSDIKFSPGMSGLLPAGINHESHPPSLTPCPNFSAANLKSITQQDALIVAPSNNSGHLPAGTVVRYIDLCL